MKSNNEAIRISERAGVARKVYEVLREWGYSENVIQSLLAEEATWDDNSQKAERALFNQEITPALIES